MFCVNCGFKIKETSGDKFCLNYGEHHSTLESKKIKSLNLARNLARTVLVSGFICQSFIQPMCHFY